MPEFGRNTESDRNLSEAEALAMVSKIGKLRFQDKLFFGENGQIINDLIAILMDDRVVDLELIYLTGELSDAEFEQCMRILPDIPELQEKIYGLARRFSAALTVKRVEDMIRAQVAGKKKNGINHFFREIKRVLQEFQLSAEGCLRNRLLTSFLINVEEIFKDRFEEAFAKLYPDRFIPHSSEQLTPFREDRKRLEEVLAGPVCANNSFMAELSASGPITGQAAVESNAQLINKFREITKLAEERRIPVMEYKLRDDTIIRLFSDDFISDGSPYYALCTVQIILDKEDFDDSLPQRIVGTKQFSFVASDGIIYCALNRGSGELTFISNQAISLRTVMSGQQYAGLKKVIYDLLLFYLRSKEPDIVYASAAPKAAEKQLMVATAQEVAATMADESAIEVAEVQDDVVDDGFAIGNEEVPAAPVEPSAPAPTETSQAIGAEEGKNREKNREYLKRLKGLSSDELLQKLKRLLGDPLKKRGKGSHQVFHSSKTGKNFVIPAHGKNGICLGMVLRGLDTWGASLEEFFLGRFIVG